MLRGTVLEDLVYPWLRLYGYCQATLSRNCVSTYYLTMIQVVLVWRAQTTLLPD